MNHIHERDLEPSRFLVENVGILPKGRALDVAMGRGRNALYLALMGFQVEGVDISPEAVKSASRERLPDSKRYLPRDTLL